MTVKMSLLLLAGLLVTTSRPVEAKVALSTIAITARPELVYGATILWSNPEAGRPLAIRAEDLESSFNAKIIIRGLWLGVIDNLVRAIANTTAAPGCSVYGTDPSKVDVEWGIILHDVNGRNIGDIYMSPRTNCAIVGGRLFTIDSTLKDYLQRTFAFLVQRPR